MHNNIENGNSVIDEKDEIIYEESRKLKLEGGPSINLSSTMMNSDLTPMITPVGKYNADDSTALRPDVNNGL